MRVLVCGDRDWTEPETIADRLSKLPKDTVIIEGEARGADSLGKKEALRLGLLVLAFPAQWDIHGKAAGPIRNQKMLKEGKPDLVLAFHNDIEHSKGTKHMVQIARKAGVPVEIISDVG